MKQWILLLFCVALIAAPTMAAEERTLIQLEFLNQQPDPVEPGSFVDLRWRVNNLGGQANEFTFELRPSYPFSINGDSQITRLIGPYSGGDEAAVIFFRVNVDEEAVEGDDNEINLVYYQTNRPENERIVEQEVRIESQQGLVEIADVTINPTRVELGENFTVSIDVSNLGTKFINNVKLVADLDDAGFIPFGSSDSRTVKQILGKETQTITFNLFADASLEVGAKTIPLTLTYVDSLGRNYETSTDVGVQVVGTPKYITNLEQTDIVTAGQSGQIVASISNVGKGDINFVVLELVETEDYVILTPESSAISYLGNLESDDFETGQYEIYVKPTQAESIPLVFTMRYSDEYNQEYTEQFTIEHKLFSPELAREIGLINGGGANPFVWVIVVVLIVGGIWWFSKRKKR